jgi:hypothetical protein
MTTIEILGRVNDKGELQFEAPLDLPPGEVRITIETVNPEAVDDAVWDALLSKPNEKLVTLAKKALENQRAGKTIPLE